MIGPLILFVGLLGLWALARGKAKPVLDAIVSETGFSDSLDNALGNLNLSTSTNTGSNSTSASSASGSSQNSTPDNGSHQGIVNGLVVTIDKTYAQMTNSEKDAANAYARRIGNVSA